MNYTAIYSSSDLGLITIDIAGNFLAGFTGEAETLAILIAITLIIGLVSELLGVIFGMFRIPHYMDTEEDTTEELVKELPERNEYQATLECENCYHKQKIPIVKGYNIEEAIKLGDYYCETCGSKNLKRKKAWWK